MTPAAPPTPETPAGSQPGTARLFSGTGPFHRLLSIAEAFRNRRRLAELPKHLLEDVGLTRDEAVAEARRPFWDVPPHWRVPRP